MKSEYPITKGKSYGNILSILIPQPPCSQISQSKFYCGKKNWDKYWMATSLIFFLCDRLFSLLKMETDYPVSMVRSVLKIPVYALGPPSVLVFLLI